MSKEISLATVKEHSKPNDLWIVIDNKVYDVTKFRLEHPGGEDSLTSVAGTDATTDFNDVGHSAEARELLKKFYIGDLAASDIKNKKPPVGATPTTDTSECGVDATPPAAPKQCCILH
ncbi:cytochrome b5 isoform X2 [Drosophila sulfurigaster albostrigata]|uniref:Cytochrome b5 n=1 Tax=Drosophila albomicans TaxID=7291 RepID=A0A6P8XYN6_DROAB|nr:cytochrome b5 isoform X2 [Drosophila albomicans]XP_060663873.1 cytochrome b5 isoform X2 [Drosophila nasuta]XP_062140336.1 cytochrome b5 isoform X2 [Drosophila sulfurigaster albostrigata]